MGRQNFKAQWLSIFYHNIARVTNSLAKCAVLHADATVCVHCINKLIPQAERLKRCLPLKVIADRKPQD
jgi:hypothetical protein